MPETKPCAFCFQHLTVWLRLAGWGGYAFCSATCRTAFEVREALQPAEGCKNPSCGEKAAPRYPYCGVDCSVDHRQNGK